jgi:hypothetical protein
MAKLSQAISVLVSGFLMMSANARLSPTIEKQVAENLNTCEAYQLSELGYLRVSHSRQYKTKWTLTSIVKEMIPEMAKRKKIDIRSTLHTTAAYASSGQAAKALLKIAKILDEKNIIEVKRKDFVDSMMAIYDSKRKDQGISTCLNVKWGNFYPDFHAYPIKHSTMTAVKNLFEEDIELSTQEVDKARNIGLSIEQAKELKKIGFAATIYEGQNEFMKNDVGGFKGNPLAIYGNGAQGEFVCTDEMTTHTIFLQHLLKLGYLKEFSLRDGKYAHRRPRAFADHFGIMLFANNGNSTPVIVFDPWIKDGGNFPIIADIDSWFKKEEVSAAIFKFDEDYFEYFGFKNQIEVTKDDREIPGKRDGSNPKSWKFSLEGFGTLLKKYR